jgi:hypothetical protein
VDTLHEHLTAVLGERNERYEQRFRSQQEATSLALSATKEAVRVAEESAQRWRESANEWRGAMNDREGNFMPRAEAEKAVAAATERIKDLAAVVDKLAERMDVQAGRSAGLGAGWSYLVGLIGLIVAVLTIVGIIIGTRP